MSETFYEFKRMDAERLKRIKPASVDDYTSFVAGVRAAESHYGIEKLTARANHWVEQWSEVCNENQTLLNHIESDTALLRQVLDDICGAKLCELNSMSSRAEMIRLMDKAIAALKERLK